MQADTNGQSEAKQEQEHHCRLPMTFVQDREERDLPTGRHRYVGRQAAIFAPLSLLEDMLSDAEHQSDGTDGDGLESLRRSAKRAAEILRVVVREAKRPAVQS